MREGNDATTFAATVAWNTLAEPSALMSSGPEHQHENKRVVASHVWTHLAPMSANSIVVTTTQHPDIVTAGRLRWRHVPQNLVRADGAPLNLVAVNDAVTGVEAE
jgi:hypothetical protein